MKKKIVLILSALFVTILVLIFVPYTRQEINWFFASQCDEADRYRSHIKSWPDGNHKKEALERYDKQCWDEALKQNTIAGFKHYIEINIQGKHVDKAKINIETIAFNQAIKINSPASLRDFTSKYPNGNLVEDAKKELNALENEDWKKALQSTKVDPALYYLRNYPNGAYSNEAEALIKINQFNVAFGRTKNVSETDITKFMLHLDKETYSSNYNKSLIYYDILGNDCRGKVDMTKKKRVVTPSSGQKSCSFRLKAGNLSITAIYLSFVAPQTELKRAFFPNKWKYEFTHNGCAGPGLEIKTFDSEAQKLAFKDFLESFSITYNLITSTKGGYLGYAIPDLLWGSAKKGNYHPHRGREFDFKNAKDGFSIKVDGVECKPDFKITTYRQALELKTYLKIILSK